MKYYYFFNGYLFQLFKTILVASATVFSALAFAQSEFSEAEKIAVVDVQLAVLQTEKAQAKLAELKEQDDFMDAYYQRAIIHYYQGEVNEARLDLLNVLPTIENPITGLSS